MSAYSDAVGFLDARIGLGVKPGLERMTGLLDALADPHLVVPVIHIAGTNGKTSTVRYTAALLDRQGIAVGTFISPHLEAIEERYGIGPDNLTADEFAELVAEVGPIIELYEERSGAGVTYFEVTAALAFSLFASYPVSAAVVEVGLGGRLDATNVVEPEVAVITPIGRDHMGYLGETIAEIAAEKAAIIKEGCIVVTGDLEPEAEAVIAARADEVGAQRYRYGAEFSVSAAAPVVGGWIVDIDGVYGSHHELGLRAHGRHQADNFAVALAAAEAFLGRQLDDESVAQAAIIGNPGRMELLDTAPLLMIDGAHNVPAAVVLAAALEEEFPDTRWSLVFGVMADKEYDRMISTLAPFVDRVYAVAADAPRALAADQLAATVADHGIFVTSFPSVAAGLRTAVDETGANGAVLVAGSLYVAGEARRAHLGSR